VIALKEFYRRRLPHYQPQDATFFITFRLAGSLPTEIIAQLMEEREFRELLINKEKDARRKEQLLEEERRRYFGHFDSFLDKAQSGNKWLAGPKVADIVGEAIKHRDGKAYDLLAFCIMPNHVHLVIDVERSDASRVGRRVSSPYIVTNIIGNLKWYTALKANTILNRSGPFWQHESHDHVVRNDAELHRVIEYVAYNPVKAGLCKDWHEWKWTYVKEGYLV
jgi:REP element-mobilizing transposase RayT